MIKLGIGDGQGRGTVARVSEEGALHTVVHPHPPSDDFRVLLPYRHYLTDDGLVADGSNEDMRVNGSATPQYFYVAADPNRDIYVKNLSVVIVDANSALNEFGNLAALSNGCRIYWQASGIGEINIATALKSNFDFVRLARGQPAFGDAAGAFRANNVVSTSEGYLPVIDFSATFGMPWGLKLRKASEDRVAIEINDDVSAVDAFNVIAYGVQH